MKKILVTFLKVGISFGLLAYLIWDSTRGAGKVNVFTNLVNQPKNWWLLAAAWTLTTSAVLLTFIRWWYLVRALDVPLRFPDAVRIGFWGYLFNLAPLGIVGGDVVKAVMLAHEQPRSRAKAVASVILDRAIGLYVLFLVASAAIILTEFWRIPVPEIHLIVRATFIITLVSTVGVVVLFLPGVRATGPISRALGKIPHAGHMIESLLDAIEMYRNKPIVLFFASVMSVGVHCVFAMAIYLVARGLPGDVHSFSSHFVIMPISAVTGVLPLPLGPFEFVLEFLYTHVPEVGVMIPKGQGLVVALSYRLFTLLTAGLGICLYLRNRREVSEAIHESEQVSPE
jgi:glycosyltransferase 2 family protein